MNRMRAGFCVVGLLAILCIATPVAYADSIVAYTGNYGYNAGGVYTSPYRGTIDGQPVDMICDSYLQGIPGSTWQAAAHPFSNLTGARFYTGVLAAAQHNYNAAAYLGEILLSGTLSDPQQSQVSYALWAIFTPSAITGNNLSDVFETAAAGYEQQALNATNSNVNAYANWTAYTPTGRGGDEIQEMLVRTPESPALALLVLNLSGLLALCVLFRRRLVRR